MDLKSKYQYTYFIKPFKVKEKNYKKYLIKLLKDKKMYLKIWEKEANIEIYDYFLPGIREKVFYGFDKSNEQLRRFKNLNVTQKANILSDQECVQFSYKLKKDTPGKIGDSNGIFFGINKIDIICFNTGICFILLKCCVEDIKNFTDILNFNYKFKEVNSELSDLKHYEKISIQSDLYKNSKELKDFLSEYTVTKDSNLKYEDEKFYVYSYTCIDGENWSNENMFEDIKAQFWKYKNVLPSEYNVDVKENCDCVKDEFGNMEYARMGVNKNAVTLLCSGINSYNYTRLNFEFENQYLYTYIFALYQATYLKKVIHDVKAKKNIKKVRKNLNAFLYNMQVKEITKDKNGMEFYKRIEKEIKLDNLYLETMEIYGVALNSNKVENEISTVIVWIIVGICVVLNILNTVILLKLS